jgi:hypothetical protein
MDSGGGLKKLKKKRIPSGGNWNGTLKILHPAKLVMYKKHHSNAGVITSDKTVQVTRYIIFS